MINKYGITSIKWVDIKTIKLWKENPRKNEGAAEKLAPLIKLHGFKSPIVVWSKDNTIYKGNTSYKAALINKMHQVPVAFVDFPSKTAAQAYAIADNKAGEFSEWDSDMLASLMAVKELKRPEQTGFQAKEIRELLMMPDMDRMNNLTEFDVGILSTIRIISKPEKKDEIKKYLEKTLLRKFSKDVLLK